MKKNINKKGFTLSEILVTIAIISVIMLIAVPSIISINSRVNKRLYESKKELILISAKQYGMDNLSLFNEDTLTITVYDLIKTNYIKADKDKNNLCENSIYKDDGCIFNPEDDSIINEKEILLTKSGYRVTTKFLEN